MQRILAQVKLRPHRVDRCTASNDPHFEAKAADIIELYVNPPQPAAVFCVDEHAVEQFLADHPKVRLHFTPTYSSWLNQVEIWFAKIERDVIARRVFTSVSDLRRKLMKYIRAHAERARPIRWTYNDKKRRITAKRITGTAHESLVLS